MQIGSFELSVAVPSNGGRTTKIREYGHNGLTYVEGRKGQPFVLHFKNNSAERVLAVPSIDGVSVVDGNEATGLSRGYIVEAYSSIDIKGWRTSMDEVAEFVFEGKDGSYAKKGDIADSSNCGVIGCLVYEEKDAKLRAYLKQLQKTKEEHHHHHHHYPIIPAPPMYPKPPYSPWWQAEYGTSTAGPLRCYNASNSVSEDVGSLDLDNATVQYTADIKATSVGSTPAFNLGTAFGKDMEDKVGEVTFKRGSVLQTLNLYYTDAEGLAKVGIRTNKAPLLSKDTDRLPVAFNGFCKRPTSVES